MNKEARAVRDSAVVNDFINNVRKSNIAINHNVSRPTIDGILKANGITWQDRKSFELPAMSLQPKNGRSLSELTLSIINSYTNGIDVKSLAKLHNVTRQRIYQHLESAGITRKYSKNILITDETISVFMNSKASIPDFCKEYGIPYNSFRRHLSTHKIKRYCATSQEISNFRHYFDTCNLSIEETAKLLGISKNRAYGYINKYNIRKGGKRPPTKVITEEMIKLYLTTEITQKELAIMFNMSTMHLNRYFVANGIKKKRKY